MHLESILAEMDWSVISNYEPACAHGDDLLKLPHTGWRAHPCFAEAQSASPVGDLINGPVSVRVAGMGDVLTLQKCGHGGEKLMGKDGDHRFREILHRLYIIRVDNGAGCGIKFR